ncbi:MAG: PAS domain S-box protein, partial [Gemmataceae bacterium]|nr:PAS domain S-box protein [Gemmataceae bacterium]
MGRSRIFWRFVAVFGATGAVAVGLTGWLLVGRAERQGLAELRRHLTVEAELIDTLLGPTVPDDRRRQILHLGQQRQRHITVIDADGKVLADSQQEPPPADSLLDLPEVQQAAAEGVGLAIRVSSATGQKMLYVARRGLGESPHFTRLGLPLGDFEREAAARQRLVWAAVATMVGVATIISALLARRLVKPVVEVTAAAQRMTQGQLRQRLLFHAPDEIGALVRSVNDLSQTWAERITAMDQDRRRLRAIFRSMIEGVVVVDAEATVLFANEAATNLLGAAPDALTGRKIWQVFRHHQLSEAVERVLASSEPVRSEFEWPGAERKMLAIHGVRLPEQELAGAVLVIHDITHVRMLERVRQEFVANVSHELKTPLASIHALVETLLDGALHDPDHNVKFLERIRENGDRLHRLVQDLLTLGRIESGEEAMEVQPLEVAAAVE